MPHNVVSSEEWLEARLALLAKEKELSKLRDELTAQRMALPWEKVDKDYTFATSNGNESLAELFGEHSQLLIYHFMFDPEWDEACKICTLLGDHYDPLVIHLKARDVSLVTVSRAPFAKIDAYKQRMGWSFKWVSSFDSTFNQDFKVTFTQQEWDEGSAFYNYSTSSKFPTSECPGISAFAKGEDGAIYHTYSAFARGLENLLGIYNFLDLVPKGRNEQDLPYGMAWAQRKDQYGDDSVKDPYA